MHSVRAWVKVILTNALCRYQSRAFLLLPMCFNIGVIVGPIVGGSLADPIHSYPHLFGPGSFFGGKHGVGWMERWPFALPSILNAIFTFAAFLAILFGLDEVGSARISWASQDLTYLLDARGCTVPKRLGPPGRKNALRILLPTSGSTSLSPVEESRGQRVSVYGR